MPIDADMVPIAPTCHVFSLPPQNQPVGKVLTECVKSNDNRNMEIISIFCLAMSAANAFLFK